MKKFKSKKFGKIIESWEKDLIDFENALLEIHSYEDHEVDHKYIRLPKKWAYRLHDVPNEAARWRDFWTGGHDLPLYIYVDNKDRVWVRLRNTVYNR